jgi:acyl-CoA synthetase (AMP-forming)/AMP-acid ligase II
MPVDLLRQAMAAFKSCGFSQSYGSTEAGAVTVLDPQAHVRAVALGEAGALASCGRPMSGRSVRIVDGDRRPLSTAAVGEIEVCSPDMMRGYWRDGSAAGASSRDQWLQSGDIGYLDAEGLLYVIDRKNDMIVTGGENVFPSEVEEQLCADPDVQEAVVFGIPDSRWVQRVAAAVVLRPGSHAKADELIRRLRARLAAYKCPKEVFLTDRLPKNAAGKVLRKDLRAFYSAPAVAAEMTGRT